MNQEPGAAVRCSGLIAATGRSANEIRPLRALPKPKTKDDDSLASRPAGAEHWRWVATLLAAGAAGATWPNLARRVAVFGAAAE